MLRPWNAGKIIALALCPSVALADAIDAGFPRSVTYLDSSYEGNFSQEFEKTDIFIIGREVHLDTPIESSGGNVTIVADDLYIGSCPDQALDLT